MSDLLDALRAALRAQKPRDTSEICVHTQGRWIFKCRRRRDGDGYLAWCSRSPSADALSPLSETGEVFFEFCATADDAVAKLVAEVGA